jgi:hypothetical protein
MGLPPLQTPNFDSAAHTHDLRGSKIHNCDLMFLAGWCDFALIQYSDFLSCFFLSRLKTFFVTEPSCGKLSAERK